MLTAMKTKNGVARGKKDSIRSGLLAVAAVAWAACGLPAEAVPRRVLFLAGPKTHGSGEHEHLAGSLLLADALESSGAARAQVIAGWPALPEDAFAGVSAIVIYCDGEGAHLAAGHWQALDSMSRAGVGLAFLHYALVVAKGEEGGLLQDWVGGYYETWWSVNPVWEARFEGYPAHPVASGVRPFTMRDEWYFHMRFRASMQGVTPLLTALPPVATVAGQPDSPHGSNPAVRAEVAAGIPQHMAWVAETPGRGRGFGFTGGHTHAHWTDPDLLRLTLNALAWTAGAELPSTGFMAAFTAAETQAYLTRKVPAFVPWETVSLHPALPRRRGPSGRIRYAPDGRTLPVPRAALPTFPFTISAPMQEIP